MFSSSRSLLTSALAELAGHHDGADENRRNQQAAAKRQPQHRPPDRRGKVSPGGCRSGLHAVHVVKQIVHSPFSREHAYDAQMP